MRRALWAAALLLGGCVTAPKTVFEATYLHPGWEGASFSTVVVLPISDEVALRKAFSDTVVQYLSAWTDRAARGYDVLPRSVYDPQATGRVPAGFDTSLIRKRLADAGFQAALTVAYRPKETRAPGAPHAWSERTLGEYFPNRYAEAHAGGPAPAEALIETNLYDTATGRVIWSSHSRTVETADDVSMAQSYAAAVVGELVKRGLIAKKAP
ncbi:MAG: hypothetical protein KGL53_00595 [Elusimicrobia bacterium]|nr:hypothetical protein [Elusimicrobiota bacterium]